MKQDLLFPFNEPWGIGLLPIKASVQPDLMPRCGDDQEVLGVDEWVKILVCNIPGDSHFEPLEVSVSKKLSRDSEPQAILETTGLCRGW